MKNSITNKSFDCKQVHCLHSHSDLFLKSRLVCRKVNNNYKEIVIKL